MGLAALLGKVLDHKPRYVTLDGRVVANNVIEDGPTFRHPKVGPVSQVEPHRFHGGQPQLADLDYGPWWDACPQLLEAERQHMARRFPGFLLEHTNETSRPFWLGQIDTGRGKFVVAVCHRAARDLPPRVQVLRPTRLGRFEGGRWRRSPHMYDNDDLCVCELEDWDGSRHDATTAVAWTAHWLAAYTEWRMSGVWPCDGYIPRASRAA